MVSGQVRRRLWSRLLASAAVSESTATSEAAVKARQEVNQVILADDEAARCLSQAMADGMQLPALTKLSITGMTDAGIAANKWVVLEDDQGIFNADNILPVGTKSFVDGNTATLDKVSKKLTTANVTALNKRYDIDKDDADTIAKDFITDEGL